jgi:hypothetical protein
MQLPSPGFLLHALARACRRFPATMLSAVVGVIVLFMLIGNGPGNDDILVRTWMGAQLGLPLLTGIVAFCESANWSSARTWLAQGIGLLVLTGYTFFLFFQIHDDPFEYVQLPRYVLFLIVAHLFVSIAPYLNKRSVADFWEYNRRLFANFVVGATFTLILYSGLALAVLAVDKLFNLDVSYLIYGRLFILLAGIFNTAYFLYHFPDQYEFEAQDASYNAVFKNLCKYILIPIVGLYFLILYAYGAKILGTWSLPRGFVGSLVIGFSVAGIFTYLLNFYLPDYDDSKVVQVYRRWFWPVLLPLTVLLFAAVFKRVGDYGFTEPRYIVLLTGIWLALTCVYFLVSKSDNLKFIPISLGVVALVLAIGPLSAFSVSSRSQTGLLEKILERNGRWQNGSLKQGTAPMLQSEVNQVESILMYLDQRGELENAYWLPMPLSSFPTDNSIYNDSGRVSRWLGIRAAASEETIFNITSTDFNGKTDIRGYTYFYPLRNIYDRTSRLDEGYCFESSTDGKKLVWQLVKNKVVTPVDSFNLEPVLLRWQNAMNESEYLQLTEQTCFIDLSCRKGVARVRVEDAAVRKDSTGLHVMHLNGQLFLKEK